EAVETVELPDGSILRVNADSAVDIAYTRNERRIFLTRGEANFSVLQDVKRPFVVRIDEVEVHAIGTTFNVRREADAINVLVTEGRVQLDATALDRGQATMVIPTSAEARTPRKEFPLLSAGERIVVAAPESSVRPREFAVSNVAVTE